MKLKFDEVKATQAAAYLLGLAKAPMEYLSLIKLLYIADREAIRDLGLPITTDSYFSLKFGPVTSNIYDRIKRSGSAVAAPTFWSAHVGRLPGKPVVVLSVDPGTSELSRAEERILRSVYEREGAKGPFRLAQETHEFPEWSDPGGSSIPIALSEIVHALGLSEEEAAHVSALVELQHASSELAR